MIRKNGYRFSEKDHVHGTGWSAGGEMASRPSPQPFELTSSPARTACGRQADFGEPDRILAQVDRDILPLPIAERRRAPRKLHAQHATDDDRMRMAFDDVIH